MSGYDIALGFAYAAHEPQTRKYTYEPYAVHCIAVARIVRRYIDNERVWMAALLHDVLEDTTITEEYLHGIFPSDVVNWVKEVTDVSQQKDGNRAVRKALDREHLAKSSYEGASIKLADLIDNTETIVEYDPEFATVYLQEKELLLPVLRQGHPALWEEANELLRKAKLKLEGVQLWKRKHWSLYGEPN